MNRSRQIIRFQFFVGSLSLLIFILFSYQMYLNQVEGRVTDENLFTTRKGKVVVIEVTEGGASDRAGMLVADTILSINGQGFDNSQDADKILRASEAGSLMDYEIKRGDQSIHLKVQAAKQRIQLRSVIGYLVILEWLALSLFLAWRRADRFAARFMSIGCMAIAPLIGANYIFQVSPPFITIILLALSIFVGSSVFIHAHFYMNVTECVNKKVSLVWIRLQYILGFIPLLYFIVLLISGVRSLTLADTRGVILFVMIAVFAAYFFGFILYQFFMTYKQQPGSKLLLFAWLVMFALPSMTGGALLNFGFNQASFLFVTCLYVPIAYFYIITKYRYYDINVVLKQSLQYKFVSYSIMALLVIFFSNLIVYLIDLDIGDLGLRIRSTAIEIGSTETRGFSDRPLFIFIGSLAVIIFVLLRKRIQSYLVKKYNRQGYDYKNAYADISDAISTSVSIEELNRRVVNGIRSFMKLKSIVLFLPGGKSFDFVNCCDIDADLQKRLETIKIDPAELKLKESVPVDQIAALSEFKQSLMFAVPLLIKDKLHGILLLGGKLSDEAFNRADLDFVESMAKQYAVALNSLRLLAEQKMTELLQQELKLAKDIQLSLLPKNTPRISGIEVMGYYQAAQEVGGDYYDFLQYQNGKLENAFTAVLGDVSGKGVSASLYMSRFQGVMRSIFHSGIRKAKDLIISTNNMVCTDIAKSAFVTCLCAQIDADKKQLTVVRAGHLPLLYYSAKTNELAHLEPSGLGLGLTKSEQFDSLLQEEVIDYSTGDIFLLYSDGISEAMNGKQEEYGFERLVDVIRKNKDQAVFAIKEKLTESINQFVGDTAASDDITFILIKCI